MNFLLYSGHLDYVVNHIQSLNSMYKAWLLRIVITVEYRTIIYVLNVIKEHPNRYIVILIEVR